MTPEQAIEITKAGYDGWWLAYPKTGSAAPPVVVRYVDPKTRPHRPHGMDRHPWQHRDERTYSGAKAFEEMEPCGWLPMELEQFADVGRSCLVVDYLRRTETAFMSASRGWFVLSLDGVVPSDDLVGWRPLPSLRGLPVTGGDQ